MKCQSFHRKTEGSGQSIWKPRASPVKQCMVKPSNQPQSLHGDQGLITKADEKLGSYGSWKSYHESFTRQKPKEGNFFLAKLFQDQTMEIKSDGVSSSISRKETHSMTQGEENRKEPPQTPTKSGGMITGEAAFATIEGAVRSVEGRETFFTPSMPGSNVSSEYTPDDEQYTMTIDEQIVNTALLNFLKAITENFPGITHHWTIHRNALHATVKERELYEARTVDIFQAIMVNRLVLLLKSRRQSGPKKWMKSSCRKVHRWWRGFLTSQRSI